MPRARARQRTSRASTSLPLPCSCFPGALLCGAFARHLRTLLSRFVQANRNRLSAALDLSARAGLQRPVLPPAHCALDCARRFLRVTPLLCHLVLIRGAEPMRIEKCRSRSNDGSSATRCGTGRLFGMALRWLGGGSSTILRCRNQNGSRRTRRNSIPSSSITASIDCRQPGSSRAGASRCRTDFSSRSRLAVI